MADQLSAENPVEIKLRTEDEVEMDEKEKKSEVSDSPTDNGENEAITENSQIIIERDENRSTDPPEPMVKEVVQSVQIPYVMPMKTEEIVARPYTLDQYPRMPVYPSNEALRPPPKSHLHLHPSPTHPRRSPIYRLCIPLLLTALVAPYLLGGAWLFSLLEEQREVSQMVALSRIKNDTAILLATELRQVRPDEPLWAKYVFKYLDVYEEQLMESVGMRDWRRERGRKWSKVSAFFYSLSLVTTTGYGSMTPSSEWGRTATVSYSLVGVPLMIAWLAFFGHFLASGWFWMFKNLCCQYCAMSKTGSPTIQVKKSSVRKIIQTRSNSIAPIEGNSPPVNGNTKREQDSKPLQKSMGDLSVRYPNESEVSHSFESIEEKLSDLDHAVATVFSIVFLAVYFVFGSVVLAITGDWTVTDSLYYNFLMFSTLGPSCTEVERDAQEMDIKHNVYYIVFLIIGYCIIFMNINLIFKFYKPKRKFPANRMQSVKNNRTLSRVK